MLMVRFEKLLNMLATLWNSSWRLLVAIGVIAGALTALVTMLGWWPQPPPDLSIAVYDVDSQGRRRITESREIEGGFDLEHLPQTYLTAPLQLAIRSNRPQQLEHVRVRLLYDPSLTVSSTAAIRQTRSGEIAYEQEIGVIARDDRYAYLPLVDTLRIANMMRATDIVTITRDNVPTYLRTLVWLPYSADEVAQRTRVDPSLGGVARRDIPITVIVSAAGRPDVHATIALTFQLGLTLLYPPSNSEPHISRTVQESARHAFMDFSCGHQNQWSARSPYTGGVVSYRECRLRGGGNVQVVSYNGEDKRWIYDRDLDNRVETELLDTDNDGLADTQVDYGVPLDRIRWDQRAVT